MDILVRESSGKVWHFYCNMQGMCCCVLNKDKSTEYQLILPNVSPIFDIIIDDSDCIHIICQENSGDLLYVTHFNSKWHKTIILKARKEIGTFESIKIKRIGNLLNLFCVAKYQGNKMLTHQILESADSVPNVLDIISDDFSVCTDSMGNIYAIYNSIKENNWITKKYIWSKKEWTQFDTPISLIDANSIFIYTNSDDTLCYLYQLEGSIFSLTKDIEVYLGSGRNPVYSNNAVIWEGTNDNKIFIKKQTDVSPTVIMPGGFTKPIPIHIRTTSNHFLYNTSYCFGYISQGTIKLYGIDGFFATDKLLTDNNNTENHIKKIEQKLLQIEQIIKEIQGKLIDMDIDKTNHRLNDIETVVSKIASSKIFKFF